MISAAKSKLIRSLQHKKYRDQHRLFLVEGEKMVLEILTAGPENAFKVRDLIATSQWLDEHHDALQNSNAECIEASRSEIKKVSLLVTPQPVLALVSIPAIHFHAALLRDYPVLAFESIRDPGNLGTIIRTADWFGIRHIICTPDSTDCFNPKVVQSTMGAICRVQVYYQDLQTLLESENLKEKAVFGTFMEGENLYESSFGPNPLILFGNESRGLSESLSPYIQHRVTIPAFTGHGKGSESLNLASSVAVVCSELRRG
jgi:TrmH family RNA methyltransferase